jgi:hypothetical protein
MHLNVPRSSQFSLKAMLASKVAFAVGMGLIRVGIVSDGGLKVLAATLGIVAITATFSVLISIVGTSPTTNAVGLLIAAVLFAVLLGLVMWLSLSL